VIASHFSTIWEMVPPIRCHHNWIARGPQEPRATSEHHLPATTLRDEHPSIHVSRLKS
jgi:hypothetical protein